MIIVRIWEGLGNQMFQYAYAKLLQKSGKQKVFLEARRIYRNTLPHEDMSVERKCGLHHFNISLKFIKPDYLSGWSFLERKSFVQKIKFRLAEHGFTKYKFANDFENQCEYNGQLLRLTGNYYVMGHFFHRKYIEPIREELLQEFTIKNGKKWPKTLNDVLEKDNTISVHIRRGDYLYADCAQVLNREMQKGRYYERAIQYLTDRMKEPVFLFFSDDIEWVKEHFTCEYKHIYVSELGLKDYEEMMVMAKCKNNIIANSTFSFWGGWLNQNPDKIVIAPKHWMPSIIPNGWVLL